MSRLNVDKITGKTGTNSGAPITLSGDTVTLGSGVTNNAGVASGTIASGVTQKVHSFSAYVSSQVQMSSDNTWYEVSALGTWTERWNSGQYASGRFTPTKSGIYLCGYTVWCDQLDDGEYLHAQISQIIDVAIKEIKDASIKIAVDSVKKIITTSVDKSKLDAVFQKNLNETKEELKKINS